MIKKLCVFPAASSGPYVLLLQDSNRGGGGHKLHGKVNHERHENYLAADFFEKISDFCDFAPSFLSQKWGFGFGKLEKKTGNRGFQVKIEDFGVVGVL